MTASNAETSCNFMSSLGLQCAPQSVPSCSSKNPVNPAIPPAATSRSSDNRPKLRRQTKRQQLLSLIRNNPFMNLISERGKQFTKDLDDPLVLKYPLEYERHCRPNSGFPILEKQFPTVTKRVIIKHGEYPHIYTYKRRQRIQRYVELVVGLKKSCWHLLNRCKKSKLVLSKLNPKMKRIAVPSRLQKSSYLERS